MKNILFAIYTEYQLLLAVNEMLQNYDSQEYDVTFLIKRSKRNGRLCQELNLSQLPVSEIMWDFDLDSGNKIDEAPLMVINQLLEVHWDKFIYFQEEDRLTVILANVLMRKGTKNVLFQDGLKPYNAMKSRSLGQVKWNIRQMRWLRSNNFKANPIFSLLNCHRYAYLKATSKVFLTFPEAYHNWNNKPIGKIEIQKSERLKEKLEEVFLWDDELMKTKAKSIFFVSQFMRDDGTFELKLLDYLIDSFPNHTLYIKFHPLSLQWDKAFVEKVKEIGTRHDIQIVDSKIPAELFIMQLKDSIVVSSISTSMFLDNPDCRFYYVYEIAKAYIPRFGRYHVLNPTPHVMTVQKFEDIK
jgi:predicted metal-binding protein